MPRKKTLMPDLTSEIDDAAVELFPLSPRSSK
jgi:hypothetical protein